MKSLRADYLPPLVLLIATAIYLNTAYSYPPAARAVPAGVAWAMLLLVALDLVSRTPTRLGAALKKTLNPGEATEKKTHYGAAQEIAAVLWIAGFAALLVVIGILYAVPVFVFASLVVRGRRPLWLAGLLACLAAGAIWILFSLVLHVELYPGLLLGGA